MRRFVLLLTIVAGAAALPGAQATGLHAPFDRILDVDVRDGYVYYRALKADRARLDAYVASLGSAAIDQASRDEQLAFWINAYNAFVLQTVIDHYPIPARTSQYPPHSIRQISGAFERLKHRAAGRSVTLDEIEKTILPPFADPRVYFALGRGAVGGGRLHSEAYTAERLQAQLAEVASECDSRPQCVQIDTTNDRVLASPIFSWHEQEFVAAEASKAPQRYADRSPVERAILGYIAPKLLTTEREALAPDRFQVVFHPFDWSLNDLTGRGGR